MLILMHEETDARRAQHRAALLDECWKLVRHGQSCFEVSDHGRVRNHRTGRLYACTRKGRYYVAAGRRVHRLVALAFIRNEHDLPTVNHIDHDPSNNHVSNLEWASYAYQNQHRRKPPPCVQRLISSREVVATSMEDGAQRSFDTIECAARFVIQQRLTRARCTNSVKAKICAVALRRFIRVGGKAYLRKTAYKHTWAYADAELLPGEEWRPIDPSIVNGTRHYSVSSEGRIRNRTGRVSSGTCREGEYTTVSVGGVNYLLHIIVAKTFLSAARGGQTQVDHKDGNQGNARAQNLEWVTPSENVRRSRAVALQRPTATPADEQRAHVPT